MGTGNTSRHTVTDGPPTVHPRGHGEHAIALGFLTHIDGSSPWARGTPYGDDQRKGLWRFIPVGTGNTKAMSFSTYTPPVHPRGHGEHLVAALISVSLPGSSPWARGTHEAPELVAVDTRFIPVGTGNTFS